MSNSRDWLTKRVACCLVVILITPMAEPAVQAQAVSNGQQVENTTPVAAKPQQPDSQVASPDTGTAQAPAADQSGQSSTSQSTPEQEKKDPTKPLGTAAAPYEKTTGVAASRPAGAVIAPAKQKRARSFLIRVSVIVGAAVAVGTVAALSKSSPSKP
jgi:hypothetical protein